MARHAAERLTSFVFCSLDWEAFEGLVRRNPEAGRRLLRILADG
jgi:hypothetical protein